MTIGIIICAVILCLSIFFYLKTKARKVDLEQQQKKKKQLEQSIDALNQQLNDQDKDLVVLNKLIQEQQSKLEGIKRFVQDQQNIGNDLYLKNGKLLAKVQDFEQKTNNLFNQQKETIEKRLEDFKTASSLAAEKYFDNLQEAYKHADAAHIQKMTRLKEEQDSAAAALNNLKETRKAAYEAVLKEKEIKENKDNYRLLPLKQDLEDIYTLEHIKQGLHKPRILSMLIWQTYFQPLAKKQFPVILKDKTKMGIYKITNIKTDESYIGQSVDIYKRWSDHCKAGLGIDTPVGNKLYKAMLKDGLQNFTFELLCQCSKEELDEKERYFIELYQADLYGYNGNTGVKSKL